MKSAGKACKAGLVSAVIEPPLQRQNLARPARLAGYLAVGLILLAGIAIRLYDLYDAPLDFHATRQMHSALIARGMYYASLDGIPEWQRERAVQQWRAQELIEPQIMETLTAWTYRVAGADLLWAARLYAIGFWMLGGVGLFLLARRLYGETGGLCALLLYTFLQYAILASRSFQPDPLMAAGIIWTLWAMQRWTDKPSWGRAVTAGVLGGLAIYVKSPAVFFIAGGWIGMILATRPITLDNKISTRLSQVIRNPQIWIIAALSVLPYAAYHLYAANILGLLGGQFSLRFFPQMWLDPLFYLRWALTVREVIPLPWLMIGVLGIFMAKNPARGLLIGLWVGYLLYGMVFSYYVTTHDYYHLPLIPLAALSAAGVFQTLANQWKKPAVAGAALLTIGLAGVLAFDVWDARRQLKAVDYRQEVQQAAAISELLSPQDRVVSLGRYYSTAFAYWGWLNVDPWFGTGDFNLRRLAGEEIDYQVYFQEKTQGMDFFLITDFEEYAAQPELQEMLSGDYPVYREGEGFIIYSLNTSNN